MRIFYTALLLMASIATIANAQLPYQSTLTTADSRHSVNICPVFELKAGEDESIRIDFQNTSESMIRYHTAGRHGVGGLSLMLYRDGKIVPNWITLCFSPSKNDVRELKPGEVVSMRINPNALYKEFTPGRYELRFEYRVSNIKDRFDLTDFKHEQRPIAYIEVFAPMPESDDRNPR